jgi:hypothetical protein
LADVVAPHGVTATAATRPENLLLVASVAVAAVGLARVDFLFAVHDDVNGLLRWADPFGAGVCGVLPFRFCEGTVAASPRE